MKTIPNRELTENHIPNPDSDYQEIQEFALTFNGYDLQNCAEIANSKSAKTLTELRASLFFEQRRYRHFGYFPSGKDLNYIINLVTKIRTKIQEKDFD